MQDLETRLQSRNERNSQSKPIKTIAVPVRNFEEFLVAEQINPDSAEAYYARRAWDAALAALASITEQMK